MGFGIWNLTFGMYLLGFLCELMGYGGLVRDFYIGRTYGLDLLRIVNFRNELI